MKAQLLLGEGDAEYPWERAANREQARRLAAIGGPKRCECGEPAQHFMVDDSTWLCPACFAAYLATIREQAARSRQHDNPNKHQRRF